MSAYTPITDDQTQKVLVAVAVLRLHFESTVGYSTMPKAAVTSKTRIKIGGVEVVLRPQPQKGSISEARLRSAVAKAVASEHTSNKK